ncbi:MAG: Fic family protein [Allosphingosinicella sp.]
MRETGLKLHLDRLEIDPSIEEDFAAADRALRSLESKSSGVDEWSIVYELSYQAAASTFVRRQDQINASLPGRLPVDSRPAPLRVAALRSALPGPWPPGDVAADAAGVHKALFQSIAPELAGAFRSDRLHMGPGYAPDLPEHVTVEPAHIGAALDELGQAVAGLSGHHALVPVTVLYAGIVNIHPFTDGNGRTARTLADSARARAGLVARPLLCMESALRTLDRRNGYLLNRLHDFGEWPKLLSFFARSVELAAQTTEQALKTKIARAFLDFQ